MNEFVEKGLISSFGYSNWNAKCIADANMYEEKYGIQSFTAVQNGWSRGSRVRRPFEDTSMIVMGFLLN